MVHGGPEALEVLDLPEVHAGPGQVRVRIYAAAVNPTDTMARNGSRAEQQKVDHRHTCRAWTRLGSLTRWARGLPRG